MQCPPCLPNRACSNPPRVCLPRCHARPLTFNLLACISPARMVRPASASRAAELPASPYFSSPLDTCGARDAGALLVVGLVVETAIASRAAVAAPVRAVASNAAVVVVGLAVAAGGGGVAVRITVGPWARVAGQRGHGGRGLAAGGVRSRDAVEAAAHAAASSLSGLEVGSMVGGRDMFRACLAGARASLPKRAWPRR